MGTARFWSNTTINRWRSLLFAAITCDVVRSARITDSTKEMRSSPSKLWSWALVCERLPQSASVMEKGLRSQKTYREK